MNRRKNQRKGRRNKKKRGKGKKERNTRNLLGIEETKKELKFSGENSQENTSEIKGSTRRRGKRMRRRRRREAWMGPSGLGK